MDALVEEFEVFKSSVARIRWFMITAVLISVLILLHIYLEQFGFQDHQLRSLYQYRTEKYTIPVLKCYEALAVHRQREEDKLATMFPGEVCNASLIPEKRLKQIIDLPRSDLLAEYSDAEYTIKMSENTLAASKLQIRQIPLLGIEVPANDFVTVMAVMSLVFVTGVWVNCRGVRAALVAIVKRNDSELLRLARLNTVFVTNLEDDRGRPLAVTIRSLVIWLPFVSILAATVIGYRPVFIALVKNTAGHWGPMDFVFGHLVIAVVVILLHLWVGVECKFVLRDIDSQLS